MKYLVAFILLQFLILCNCNLQAQWVQVNMPNDIINSLVANGNNIYAGTVKGGVLISTDDGIKWSQVGINNIFANSLVVSENNIFACGDSVYLSTNKGTTWKSVNNGFPSTNDYIFEVLIISGNDLFVGTSKYGVYLSTNSGTAWTTASSGLPAYRGIYSLAINGNNIIAGTEGGVYRSTNNGANWTQPSINSIEALCLGINGTNIFAGTHGGVYLSTNNGTDWAAVNNGLANGYFSFAMSGPNVFVGGFGGIFLTTNNGTNWSNVGLDSNRIISLAVSNANIFAGTYGQGVWKRPLSEFTTGISKGINNLPQEYTLFQNYPNPFNPSTTISYKLRDKGFVKLKVFDMRGELIKVLVNETKEAGYYDSEFDGKGLASGVYLYRIEVIGDGNKPIYSDMKKTVLLK